MSSSGRPAAAVRMMTPPVKPCCSRNSRTMPRRRARSSRESILRDTPTWSTVGMNTRKRPGMVTWEVSRAPFVPSGSLATWTRISCPSWSRSSMASGRSRAAAPRAVAPPRPSPRRPRPRSSPGLELLELLEGVDDVGDVEEPVALEADVDEGGLHAGQHLRDPALVDVADDAALPLALDEDLATWSSSRMATLVSWSFEETIISLVIDRLRPRRRQAACDAVAGAGTLAASATTRPRAPASEVVARAGRSWRPRAAPRQLVNRRILTLRMRPKLASVAMIDEPP